MKAVIIEDNQDALDKLKKNLQAYCPQVELIGEASSVMESIPLLAKGRPQLVFLDIELEDGTAFDLLEQLVEPWFRVIFITAFESYAIKAIKYSAIDYLLKPVDVNDLIVAVNRAQSELKRDLEFKKIKFLLELIDDQNFSSIMLKDQYGVQLVEIDKIIRLEAQGSYTKVIQENRDSFTATKVLKGIEKLLPSDNFFRCHQSHVVNLTYLLRYDNMDSDLLFLKNGEKVPLAIRRKQRLLEKLKLRVRSENEDQNS